MIRRTKSSIRKTLFAAASVAVLGSGVSFAQASADEVDTYNIPEQSLSAALIEYSRQSNVTVIAPSSVTNGLSSSSLVGDYSAEDALQKLLGEAALTSRVREDGVVIISQVEVKEEEAAPGPFRVAEVAAESVGRPVEADPFEARRDMEKIVITGSNIRGVQNSASPLTVIGRDDILASGAASVQSLLEKLPSNFGGGQSEDVFSGALGNQSSLPNISGATSVNLRGLGVGSTLTLLNGRRLAPSGYGDGVDVSMIPVSALERVEVLTDGASAIYGSDAVGGVINFVLRDDFEGSETELRFGHVSDGGYRDIDFSQAFGTDWGNGSGIVAYNYNTRNHLDAADRDFASAVELPRTLMPDSERHSLLGSINHRFTDHLAASADVFLSDRESENVVSSFGATAVLQSEVKQANLSAGVTYDFTNEWQLGISGLYSVADTLYSPFDPLFPDSTLAPEDAKATLWDVSAQADGKLFSAPGGEAKLAIGAAYREETYELIGSTLEDGDRHVVSVFSELFVPLIGESNAVTGVDKLELTLAGRYEEYSDFGDTFDPKVGLLYAPLEGVSLRGTYGTSFKAPIFQNLSESNAQVIYANLPDPAAADGNTYTILLGGGNRGLGPEVAETWTAGVDIQPTSIPGLSMSATLFDIKYEDRIRSPTSSPITILFDEAILGSVIDRTPSLLEATALLNSPALFNLTGIAFGPFSNDPNDVGAIADIRLQNLASHDTRGLDGSISYYYPTARGDLSFGASATYYDSVKQSIVPEAEDIERVDSLFFPIDFKARASMGWSNGGLNINAYVNYADNYSNNSVSPVEPISSYTTMDLSASYTFEDETNAGVLSGARLYASVSNVFDKSPPFVSSPLLRLNEIGYDPTNADPLGRFFTVGVTKSW